MFCFFFFQAEDGIRDLTVTGVQTCALPIWFSGTITVALGSNPGGATLSGTLLVAAVGGVASFGDLSLNRTAPGYTLTASGGGPGPGAKDGRSGGGGEGGELGGRRTLKKKKRGRR